MHAFIRAEFLIRKLVFSCRFSAVKIEFTRVDMMKYESTRSGKNGGEFSFEEVLLGGYAPDGGLFMPVQIPKVDLSVLRSSWAKLPYPTLVFEICRLFISAEEVAHEVLSSKLP